MPIDSDKRRAAAAAAGGLPFIPAPPRPDGVIGRQDRRAVAGVYPSGVTDVAPAFVVTRQCR